MLRILAATANFDAWDAAYGDGGDQPSSEPEPFKHAQAEAREYWQGLAAQIHAYSGGQVLADMRGINNDDLRNASPRH